MRLLKCTFVVGCRRGALKAAVAVRSLGPDRTQVLYLRTVPQYLGQPHASRHCPGLNNGLVGVGDQNSDPKGRKFDPRPPVRAIFQSGPILIPDPPSEIRLAVRTCQLSAASKDMYISISACRTLQHRCHEIFPRWRGRLLGVSPSKQNFA